MHSKYDNMHINGMFYALFCINNLVLSCSVCTLSPLATYSASAVDNAIEFYFFEFKEMRQPPRMIHDPLVLFLSTRHPTKSASQYPTMENS